MRWQAWMPSLDTTLRMPCPLRAASHHGSYLDSMATSEPLQGARFGLPVRRCWENVPPSCKALVQRVLDAIERAGAEFVSVNFPSIDERTNEAGT